MKTFKEYFEAPRQQLKDAPIEIQEKIKRVCGIGKKILVNDVSASEHDFLWKKVHEILDDGFPGKTIKEIEKYLPQASFCCSDFVELPNGIVLEDEGSWMQFLAKDAALVEFERCAENDEYYFRICEAQDEEMADMPFEEDIAEYERDEAGIRYGDEDED